ncbi:MAG: peroxidase [Myxococcales bacterium]|nr:peroxidase [Myxococcales bacterium]
MDGDERRPEAEVGGTRVEGDAFRRGFRNRAPLTASALARRVSELDVTPTVPAEALRAVVNRIDPKGAVAVAALPEDVKATLPALRPTVKSFHGAKFALAYFPSKLIFSRCADMFGYMSSTAVRAASKLPFDATHQALVGALGDLMGDPGRETGIADSTIPAGFTYVGQFVDHDITLDVSSSLDAATDANTLNNMRTPALDLDSVYGRGPALDPFLYEFPAGGASSAIKLKLGANQNVGPGGPGGAAGAAGMVVKTDFDVPRVRDTNTAIIGDPRNDENLIVAQFHQTMLRFHNQVVDLLQLASFTGDIFVEAKKLVTHHYQWAVVHDFLPRICGSAAVTKALTTVVAPVGSAFRMPVEFAVAAYRFGHSMIRDRYWVNFNFPAATLGQVFEFIRNPRLPVFSNWVVDWNAFFDTGVAVPVHNKARKIDSVLAAGLETLPGFTGLMAVLAKRNLRRGLALGLPSGQAMATALGIAPLTSAQLTSGLPANEVALLNSSGGVLLTKTPLWYYLLREAAVLGGGEQLGPLGARIVADTFVRMLKRDRDSYLNAAAGFTPSLPSAAAGDFTFADLAIFAGVTQP